MAQYQMLREWAPLTDLFEKLPYKTGGLFSQDIKITCIDVVSEFLVLGTNVGMIFWYDRKRKDLERMRCEINNSAISVVKTVSTVDYMVACGNQTGTISIFQIPKPHPETLPENLKPQPKQIERYTVADLHKSRITALEWSKNGMKLFSGDKTGSIVLTEIDFYLHVCKSIEIFNESFEVVQLSYRQQRLLISTNFRSIICNYSNNKWKVAQVGKKDRKILGKFGGLIHQKGFSPNDLVLYCIRPGLRIWIADVEGEVQKTLLFKDLLCKECPHVPLLNPISKALEKYKPKKEASFGIVEEFFDNLLVTYCNDVIYILDPQNMIVLATINNLRNIFDIASNKDELFILEDDRSLIRISYEPEYKITQLDIHTDNSIQNAEEAEEIPSVSVTKNFDKISKEDFDDSILFKKTKRKNPGSKDRKDNNHRSDTTHPSSNDLNLTKPTLMNLSIVGVLPDLRSPETIDNEIKEKEKILSDVLNLEELHLNTDDPPESKKLNEKVEIEHFNNYLPIIQEQNTHQQVNIAPKKVIDIPNDWNISNIQISNNIPSRSTSKIMKTESINIISEKKEPRKKSSNDSPLSDWEIV